MINQDEITRVLAETAPEIEDMEYAKISSKLAYMAGLLDLDDSEILVKVWIRLRASEQSLPTVLSSDTCVTWYLQAVEKLSSRNT